MRGAPLSKLISPYFRTRSYARVPKNIVGMECATKHGLIPGDPPLFLYAGHSLTSNHKPLFPNALYIALNNALYIALYLLQKGALYIAPPYRNHKPLFFERAHPSRSMQDVRRKRSACISANDERFTHERVQEIS